MGTQLHSVHCMMKTVVTLLGLCLLVSAQGSYVTQQKICKQIPREICTESQVPVTKHLTEQKCSTIPTSRQECNLQQEKECYQVPEMKCFDEHRTTKTEEECHDVPEMKCSDEPRTVTDVVVEQ